MIINKFIDHTLLRTDAGGHEIIKLCNEAIQNNFASVCVNPTNIALAKKILSNSKVKVCAVIGFPLGANTNIIKVMEAKDAIEKGADELDVVINIAALKDNKYQYVLNELQAIKKITKNNVVTKAIIEVGLLNQEEVIKACEIAINSGFDFVKTSTGYNKSVTVKDVEFIKKLFGNKIGIKASGGIRNSKFAIQLITAGATRLGTSSGVEIYNELKPKEAKKDEKSKEKEIKENKKLKEKEIKENLRNKN